jgi:hypothetical protein
MPWPFSLRKDGFALIPVCEGLDRRLDVVECPIMRPACFSALNQSHLQKILYFMLDTDGKGCMVVAVKKKVRFSSIPDGSCGIPNADCDRP